MKKVKIILEKFPVYRVVLIVPFLITKVRFSNSFLLIPLQEIIMGRRNIMPDEFLLLIIVLAEAGENSMIRATKMLCSVSCLVTQLCPTLCDPMDYSSLGSSVHGDSPGENIGVGCHTLLWCIFLTQESNLPLLHCTWILYSWTTGKPKKSTILQ